MNRRLLIGRVPIRQLFLPVLALTGATLLTGTLQEVGIHSIVTLPWYRDPMEGEQADRQAQPTHPHQPTKSCHRADSGIPVPYCRPRRQLEL
jgi:hypothetical protein